MRGHMRGHMVALGLRVTRERLREEIRRVDPDAVAKRWRRERNIPRVPHVVVQLDVVLLGE
jgi:hypothetical protein